MLSALYASPAVLLTLTAFAWGLNAIFGQLATGEITPFALVLTRWTLATALMFAIFGAEIRRWWPQIRASLPTMIFMGATGFTAFNTVFYIASTRTTGINVGIIQGAMPVMVLLGAFLVYGDRVRPVQIWGVLLTLVGVAVVATQADLDILRGLQFNDGDMLMLVAALLYSLYAVALRNRPEVPSVVLFAVLAAVASICALPLAAWEATRPGYVWPTSEGWAIGVAAAVFPSCIAQLFFMRGVDLIGPGRAGAFINLVPIFAAGLSVVWLGESFGRHHAAGLALVLVGIALTQRHRQGAASR